MKCFLLLFIHLLCQVENSNAQVAIIVNKSVPINSLKASTIADIYMLDTQKWSDGQKIILVDLKSKSPIQRSFYDFIGEKPYELRKIWIRAQLTGEGKAPITVDSEDDLLKKVATTTGAIGYISLSKVTDAVKVISLTVEHAIE